MGRGSSRVAPAEARTPVAVTPGDRPPGALLGSFALKDGEPAFVAAPAAK